MTDIPVAEEKHAYKPNHDLNVVTFEHVVLLFVYFYFHCFKILRLCPPQMCVGVQL